MLWSLARVALSHLGDQEGWDGWRCSCFSSLLTVAWSPSPRAVRDVPVAPIAPAGGLTCFPFNHSGKKSAVMMRP